MIVSLPSKKKIRSPGSLAREISKLQKAGKRVVFTNGCFDLLHAGHVTYLEKARKLGDLLVVAVNTDESVRRLKGPSRPVNSTQDRMTVLSALGFVDRVTFFAEDTPLELIQKLSPKILVKGADYKKDQIVGAEWVEAHGGKVKTIPLVKGKSTTSILQKATGRRSR